MLIDQHRNFQKFHSNSLNLLCDGNHQSFFQCKCSLKTYVHIELQNRQKTFHHLMFENLLVEFSVEIYK